MSEMNPYFNHYSATNEQTLIQDMVDEQIRTQGILVYYIPRSQDNIDFIFREDPSSYYNQFQTLPMYPVNVDGFGGEDNMSFFAHEFPDTCQLIVSKRRFGEKLPTFERPQAGDLIFLTVTNSLLEIKFCEEESTFFERGNLYVYELKAVSFDYSYENMETGDTGLDGILSDVIVNNQGTDTEEFGDNSEFEAEYNDDIEFDPNNPFGTG